MPHPAAGRLATNPDKTRPTATRKAHRHAAMARKESGPPGSQLFPGWGSSAACGQMPGQMSPAQGAVGDPRFL